MEKKPWYVALPDCSILAKAFFVDSNMNEANISVAQQVRRTAAKLRVASRQTVIIKMKVAATERLIGRSNIIAAWMPRTDIIVERQA